MGYDIKTLGKQAVGFMIVGTISFCTDIGTLALLHDVLKVPTVPASIFSYVLATVLNYIGSMRHVYTHREGRKRRNEFTVFFILSTIGLLLNTFIMWVAREGFYAYGINYEQSRWYLLVKTLATAIVSIWNFSSRLRWIDDRSQKGKNAETAAVADEPVAAADESVAVADE